VITLEDIAYVRSGAGDLQDAVRFAVGRRARPSQRGLRPGLPSPHRNGARLLKTQGTGGPTL
jgi:hypothetical protein